MAINKISTFVKYSRGKIGLKQEELAQKAGVGLRFIRELEQGKETLRMDKVNQVLSLFGQQLIVANKKIFDPYEILLKYFNNNVRIFLINKQKLEGSIIAPIYENNELKSWQFIANKNATEFQKTENNNLIQEIEHGTIENVENL